MKKIMKAYKLKGKINQPGNLLITERVNLPAPNVEVILWLGTDTLDNTTSPTSEPAPEKDFEDAIVYGTGVYLKR